MNEIKYKLNGYYVIPDISSCIREFGVDGIMYDNEFVFFPNMTDVDSVSMIKSNYVEFQITIAESVFYIYVPLEGSEVSLHDKFIDIQSPNGDFLVLRLGGKIEDIKWLRINNLNKSPNYGK